MADTEYAGEGNGNGRDGNGWRWFPATPRRPSFILGAVYSSGESEVTAAAVRVGGGFEHGTVGDGSCDAPHCFFSTTIFFPPGTLIGVWGTFIPPLLCLHSLYDMLCGLPEWKRC